MMGEYDAVWVFLIALAFVAFYIYIEATVSYTHLRAHETREDRVFRRVG